MKLITTLLVFFASIYSLFAGSFTEYPGATVDQKLTEKAQVASDQAGASSSVKVFYTADGFEKVVDFYRGLGKEFKMGMPAQKLEDGTVIQKAFIILDGASDLGMSTDWLAIQNPLIGDFEFKDGKAIFIDVRKNVTAIQRIWKK